jgi:hypothetical protein
LDGERVHLSLLTIDSAPLTTVAARNSREAPVEANRKEKKDSHARFRCRCRAFAAPVQLLLDDHEPFENLKTR